MLSESPYKIGLGPKILSRARLILGSLLLLLTVVTLAGVHQGVTSGDFDRVFVAPFRQFAQDLKKAVEPIPTPSPLPSPSSTPTPIPTKKPAVPPAVKQQTQPVVTNCIRKNIREGEFASNKCYSQQDFEDLEYYLNRYNSAVFDRDGAESFMGITCGGKSEMFQQDCEKQKARKAQAEADMNKYRDIIQGIIAKGK